MNQTLEAMAQALFRSWFVDFDPVRAKAEGRQPEGMDAETAALFPSRFVDSELGEIPEGWARRHARTMWSLSGGTYACTSESRSGRRNDLLDHAEGLSGLDRIV